MFQNMKLRCFLFPENYVAPVHEWMNSERVDASLEGHARVLDPQDNNPERQALWEKEKV